MRKIAKPTKYARFHAEFEQRKSLEAPMLQGFSDLAGAQRLELWTRGFGVDV